VSGVSEEHEKSGLEGKLRSQQGETKYIFKLVLTWNHVKQSAKISVNKLGISE